MIGIKSGEIARRQAFSPSALYWLAVPSLIKETAIRNQQRRRQDSTNAA
jgi:hypothetical protein